MESGKRKSPGRKQNSSQLSKKIKIINVSEDTFEYKLVNYVHEEFNTKLDEITKQKKELKEQQDKLIEDKKTFELDKEKFKLEQDKEKFKLEQEKSKLEHEIEKFKIDQREHALLLTTAKLRMDDSVIQLQNQKELFHERSCVVIEKKTLLDDKYNDLIEKRNTSTNYN